MNDGVDRLFVGVGVSEYAVNDTLPRAAKDVAAVRKQLGFAQLDPLTSPTWLEANDLLDSVKNRLPNGGLVVFMWSGHGFLKAGLRLLTRDDDKKSDGLGFAEAIRPVAQSGAHQLLFIVDTCHAGEAISAGAVIDELLRVSPPTQKAVWVGVLASCLDVETARDGYFGRRLRALLRNGPSDPLVWPSTTEFISGEDLGYAMLNESPDVAPQHLDFGRRGVQLPVIPNPKFRPGPVVPTIIEHLLQSARGGASVTEASAFTGRVPEVNVVVGWVSSRRPGIHVITGPPGTGKSAILGRVVSWSDPQERAQLLSEGASRTHDDPGEGSVTTSVHARGLTVAQVAEQLDEALVGAGLLTRREKPRNAAQVLGDLQAARESGVELPVLAIDGVDEAGTEAFTIARELLIPLGRWATVVTATRELRNGNENLLDLLAPSSTRLDLGTPESAARSQEDVREYVRRRLTGVDDSMDSALVADLVAERATPDEMPFLLARLVTSQLRSRPIDTSKPDWAEAVASSLTDALLADIAAVTRPPHRPNIDADAFARRLLVALTWAFGAGFPLTEWAIVTDVVTVPSNNPTADTDDPAASVASTTPEDLWWVLKQLGRYLVQDAAGGQTVYRLAHRSLADALRPPWTPTADQPFDPDATVVAQSLIDRYQALLEGGVPASEPRYLWMHLWRHTAAAGPQSVDALRNLASRYDDLRPDLANADLSVADVCHSMRRRQDALALTKEAVSIGRALAETNPAFLPDLARALANLGVRHRELGQHQDALPPADEAVTTYRELTEANPAFLPDLARTLTNLGAIYRDLGRHHDALASTDKAVTILQTLAKTNPAFLPDLARALTNLGAIYRDLGRHHDALASNDKAVTILQTLAKTNPAFLPDLARALTNLGAICRGLGRHHDALASNDKAVTILRNLAETNPGVLPDLADALTNLGVSYRDLGRHHDALAPTEEAVTTYRDLTETNPTVLPHLVGALTNLSAMCGELNRHQDALAPTEQAVTILRGLAETNPAFLPDLARALTNLGISHSDLGRHQDALAPTEEAVTILRDLTETNPAALPDLASALTNLGVYYSELDRRQDALAPTEEAVTTYRDLTETNPAALPDLARALTNLGISHSDLGRHQDALAPTEEAVSIGRVLAETNPAFLPDLASALINLGLHYSNLGRHQDALAPTDKAVTILHSLADANPAVLPDLAHALTNLGLHYSNLGRHQDALAPTEKAVTTCRSLADTNPTVLPDLASALNNLSDRYRAVGKDPERPWSVTLEGTSDEHRATLIAYRVATSEPRLESVVTWVADGLSHTEDPGLIRTLHDLARTHRQADSTRFDACWVNAVGSPAPGWLTVEPALLETADAWLTTPTYTDERNHCAAHPELLDKTADTAIDEALLTLSTTDAERYRHIRDTARSAGVDVAYRPILLHTLAVDFARADLTTKRHLLTSSRQDLLTTEVNAALANLNTGDDPLALIAAPLLALARVNADTQVLDALEHRDQFPDLLHQTATAADPTALLPTAACAATAADSKTRAALALFYAAVAHVLAGADQDAAATLGQARGLDPDQTTTWLVLLASITAAHPEAAALAPLLA